MIFHSETVGVWTQGDDLLLRFKFYLLFLGWFLICRFLAYFLLSFLFLQLKGNHFTLPSCLLMELNILFSQIFSPTAGNFSISSWSLLQWGPERPSLGFSGEKTAAQRLLCCGKLWFLFLNYFHLVQLRDALRASLMGSYGKWLFACSSSAKMMLTLFFNI